MEYGIWKIYYVRSIHHSISTAKTMLLVNLLRTGRVMSRSTSQAAIALPPFRHFAATPNIYQGVTLLQDKQNGFGFARSNPRPAKPRTKGITEIRGPYYSVGAI